MSENKTIATTASARAFLDTVENETRRNDSYTLLDLIQKITGQPPVLWGNSLIGFGSYHYKYDTGREGDMLMAGFSPRKQNLAIYNTGFIRYPDIMKRLGKYKAGKSCLYINKLSDVDLDVLSELIEKAYDYMNKKYNS
ncbi:DUF1801 domain-containing protein [Maribacter algarum]|uniref:DUF1801 domain-containing protein n=1 Tax=Maribacter algarum (ex Zhang et al. 2020) TaxID=2578118 RepID=A0A5S3PSC6_9FLAO|nr:DUF1801 domain-containing protein [Maribacter algarum]TMM57539.1 DUF1801 domain-containing protein [Maribacter algarum]